MNGMAHLPFDDPVIPMPGSPISPDDDYPATVDCWGAGIASITGFQDVWALAEAQEDVIPVQQQQQQQQQTQPQSHHLGGMPAAAGCTGAATPGGPLLPASVSAQAFCSSAQSGTANFVLSSPAGVPQMGSTAMPMAPSSLAMLDQQKLQLPITMVSGPQASMQLQLQPQAQQPAYSSSGAACAAQHNMAVSQAAQPVRKQLISAVFRVAHDLLVEDAIFSYGNKRPGICMADSRDSRGDTFNGLAAASAPALPPVRRARSCGTGDACWGKSMGPAAGATSAVSAPAPAAPFKGVGTAAGVAAFASENSSTGRQQRRFVAAVRRARPSQTVPNLQLWQQQQQQQQAVTGSLLPGALALEVPAVGPAWQRLQC